MRAGAETIKPFGRVQRLRGVLVAKCHPKEEPAPMCKATMKVVLAAALLGVTIAPALACMATPAQIWPQIDAALPNAELSDTDLAKVKELRAKAFSAKRQAAVQATYEAIEIVGLVQVSPFRGGCGTYRLKKEIDAR
jgi:hypothetical protein